MSYNGSGTFVINSTGQPVVTGTVISSSTFNSLTADLGTGLTTAITKDGQTTTTAKIPFAQGISAAVASNFAAGTVGAPSIYLSTDTTTGLYRIGANNVGFAISGVKLLDLGSALVGITGALTVSTTLGVTGTSTLGVVNSGALTATGTGTFQSGNLSISAGADSGATTLTNATTKVGRWVTPHYTNSEEPVGLAVVAAANGTNTINIGGGSSTVNAATTVNIIAEANSTTVGGTTIGAFTSTGLAVTGTLGVTGAVTISASGAGLSVGPGGTSGNGIIYVTGGSDTNRGAAIDFMRAGVLKGEIGTNSLVINGTDSDLAYWANTGLGHRWYTNGSLTAGMTLSSSNIVTMSAYGAGTATFSAAGVISSVSDETWKVKDGIPTDPDAMLQKLAPGYWYYNDEKKETFGAGRQLGFYAQNVNAAIGPEAAPEPEEGKPWGYYDRSVLAVAVMSLQKALATIESLTARITALEAQ